MDKPTCPTHGYYYPCVCGAGEEYAEPIRKPCLAVDPYQRFIAVWSRRMKKYDYMEVDSEGTELKEL